jgi:hypothetical protein
MDDILFEQDEIKQCHTINDLLSRAKDPLLVYHTERKTPAIQAWGYKRVLLEMGGRGCVGSVRSTKIPS